MRRIGTLTLPELTLQDRTVDAHHQFATDAVGTVGDDAAIEEFALLIGEHRIAATVLVQPRQDPKATEHTLLLAEAAPFVGGVVVWADVTAGDIGAVLDRMTGHAKFRGLCLPVKEEADNAWLLREDVLRGLEAVAERGLTLDVIVEPRQLPSVGELAGALPQLRIALDHAGSPFIAKSEREPWGVYMMNVAPHDNVVVKLSGLVTLDTLPGWQVAHMALFVGAVVRWFGYERVMFGSDWPVHTSVAAYAEVMNAVVEAAGPMTDAQHERLMGGTARQFYRLP